MLYIKSQDKTDLVTIGDLSVISRETCPFAGCASNKWYVAKWTSNDKYHCKLGVYSTKEKAIKVLDMIQNAIVESNNEFGDVTYTRDWDGVINTTSDVVSQMPQDEEVEI